MNTLHPMISLPGILGLLILGLKQFKKIADSWDLEIFEKHKNRVEGDFIDAELYDVDPESRKSENNNGFALKAISIIVATLMFILSMFLFVTFFQVTKEEVLQTYLTIPAYLQPVAILAVGLSLIDIINRTAKDIKKYFVKSPNQLTS